MAVIADIPWTPHAANAFRSAWMPAPPPESEPAIERQTGGRVSVMLAFRVVARRARASGAHDPPPSRPAADQPLELELREAGEDAVDAAAVGRDAADGV